jgi:hypothetical protein
MLLLLVSQALAGTLAILELDGRGVTAAQATAATDALRDACFLEAGLDVLSGSDIADRIAAEHAEDLAAARAALAAGRARLGVNDADGAVAQFEEAVEKHRAARSDLARRGEMADAAWWLALALQKAGRGKDAGDAFATVARLSPGYATARATERPPAALKAFTAAEAALRDAPTPAPSTTLLREIGASTQADLIVAGTLQAGGAVTLQLWRNGVALGKVSGTLGAWPPSPIDEAWAGLAREVATRTAGGDPAVMSVSTTPAEDEGVAASGVEFGAEGEPSATPRPSDLPATPEDSFPSGVAVPDDVAERELPEDLDLPAVASGDDAAERDLPEDLDLPDRAAGPSPREATPPARETPRTEEKKDKRAPKPTKIRTRTDDRARESRGGTRTVVTAGKSGGPPRAPGRPLAERWWFWSLLFVVAGGATAGAAVALQQPAPEVTTLPDTYTVTVAAP